MFQNRITLAIIPDKTWKTEYTYLHLRYFQRLLNPTTRVVSYSSVDEALGACETDYLFVFRAGALCLVPEFFDSLSNQEVEDSLFVGKLRLASDYAILDDSMLLVNMQRWHDYGQPTFKSKVRQGPAFYVSVGSSDPYRPYQIVKESDEQFFVDNDCSSCGAEFIVLELNKRGVCDTFAQYCDSMHYFQFESDSAYHELISETRFEKQILPIFKSKVFAIDRDDLSAAKQTTAGIVVAPAVGLKALTLAEHFKAKTIVVYSHSQPALDLQKLIFNVSQKTLYSDIIDQFLEDTGVQVEDGWQEDEYAIITPLQGVQVEYVLVDPFSFEMDEFIKRLDFQSTMVFDFSDTFALPQLYYKRSFAQVNGLFDQLFSYLKSRTGPTHLFGLSPNFSPLWMNEVNMSSLAYQMDPNIDPNAIIDEEEEGQPEEDSCEQELTQDMIDLFEQEESTHIIHPEDLLPPISDVLPIVATPKPEELPVETAVISTEIVTEQDVHTSTIPSETLPQEEPQVQIQDAPSNDVEDTLISYMKLNGYESLEISDGVVKFINHESFPEFEYSASNEYIVDTTTCEWKYVAGKTNSDIRVEFHNGSDEQTMRAHVMRKVKFNPKTALKYF